MKLITGLHHITALASDAQANYDFYSGILGLRLVKKTINFDAPEVYHLYYGNETGAPGTILTFFPYPGIQKGRKGKGQVTVTSFSASLKAMDFWLKRLEEFDIPFEEPEPRFDDELFIYFEDGDGLGLEIVFNDRDDRKGYKKDFIPEEFALKGFYGITLSEEGHEQTSELLTKFMDHSACNQKDNRFRYSASGKPGDYIDVLCTPDALRGNMGAGTIHHVAFATDSESTQLEARAKLANEGLNITPVLDRQYFHSVYFREPGGVLFEIATVPPGFAIDESPEHLGEALKLPPWQEAHRNSIEKALPPLELDKRRD